MNPQFKTEYDQALKTLSEATRELNDYLKSIESKTDDTERVHYITETEGQLLEKHQDAMQRYDDASKKFFGRE